MTYRVLKSFVDQEPYGNLIRGIAGREMDLHDEVARRALQHGWVTPVGDQKMPSDKPSVAREAPLAAREVKVTGPSPRRPILRLNYKEQ